MRVELSDGASYLWQCDHVLQWLQDSILCVHEQIGRPLEVTDTPHDRSRFLQCASIGFKSAWSEGIVVIAADHQALIDSNPAGKFTPTWIGELANLVVGRLKNEFWRRGAGWGHLGLPTIMNAHFMPPLQAAGEEPAALAFRDADGGYFCAWIAGMMSPDFDCQDSEPAKDQEMPIEPGGILMF